MRQIQTLVFDKDKFNRAQALLWAERHGFKHYTSREEPNTIRIRQFDPVNVREFLGTFKLDKGVNAVYARVKQ
jgi:hypothetical protein